MIQAGEIAPAKMQRAACALMLTGLGFGIPTVALAPGAMLGLGAATLIGAAGYSGKPFGFKYHALGDVTVFLLCGPLLTFGATIAMFGQTVPGVWALGALFGLAAAAILHVNNMQDVEVDRKAGARTLALALGANGSKVFLVALYTGAVFAWASLRLPLVPFIIGSLGFIPALRLGARVVLARNLNVFPLLRVEAAQAHLAIGASVAAAIVLGGFLS